jgi:hypothetical protein
MKICFEACVVSIVYDMFAVYCACNHRCAGIDCQTLDHAARKFVKLALPLAPRTTASLPTTTTGTTGSSVRERDRNVIAVLSNLAVREDRRREGVAGELVERCEETAQVLYVLPVRCCFILSSVLANGLVACGGAT